MLTCAVLSNELVTSAKSPVTAALHSSCSASLSGSHAGTLRSVCRSLSLRSRAGSGAGAGLCES